MAEARNSDGLRPELQFDLFFRCPHCGEDGFFDVEFPEPIYADSYEVVVEFDMRTEVKCGRCGFSVPVRIWSKQEEHGAEAIDRPNLEVTTYYYLFPDPDELDIRPAPENAYELFRDTIRELTDVLSTHGHTNDGSALINRMVFTQFISAFEAYLANTLIHCVTKNPDALRQLLDNDKELTTKKYMLSDFFKQPDIILNEVRARLRKIVYHHLPLVHELYKLSLDVNVLDNSTTGSDLLKAIEYRHHCVHRNGFTFEGTRLDVFTINYITSVADILKRIASNIEAQIAGSSESKSSGRAQASLPLPRVG
jgi:hypothetical protein